MKIYRVITMVDYEQHIVADGEYEARDIARDRIEMWAEEVQPEELKRLVTTGEMAAGEGGPDDEYSISELVANDEVEHGLSSDDKRALGLKSDYELATEYEVDDWLGKALLDASRLGDIVLEVGEDWLAITGAARGSCLVMHRLCDHGLPEGEYACGPMDLDDAPERIRLSDDRMWLSEEHGDVPTAGVIAKGAEWVKRRYVDSVLTEEDVDLRNDELMRSRRNGREGVVVGADVYDMALVRPSAEVVGWTGWEMIGDKLPKRAIAHHEDMGDGGWRLALVAPMV